MRMFICVDVLVAAPHVLLCRENFGIQAAKMRNDYDSLSRS